MIGGADSGSKVTERESRLQDACDREVCRVPESCPFDCLAITAPNPRAAAAYLDELVHRVGVSGAENTKEVLILAVSDPEGVRIGSGGGTLNAVLEIDQALRATKATNDNSVSHPSEGLSAARVLLVHSGGDSQRSPTQCVCGKAWSALNSCGDGANGSSGSSTRCNTPMDLLLDHLSRLFSGELSISSGKPLDPGTLVVTACDVMLLIPPEVAATADWSFDAQTGVAGGVAGLAIAADAAKYAPNHGVYCLDGGVGGGRGHGRNGITGVSKYLQKPSFSEAETSGAFLPPSSSAGGESTQENSPGTPDATSAPEVAIDSGVVIFSGAATAALTTLAYSETFKGCTARGVAGGASALRLELYSDLLLALKTGTAEAGQDADDGELDAYLAACGPALPADHALSKARRETWNTLRGFPLGALLLKGATFVHLGTTPELMEMMTLRLAEFIKPYGLTARAASVVGAACSVEADPPAVVVNSRLDGAGVVAGGAVVEHCRFDGDGWEIGTGSLISGVRSLKADHHLRLRSGMCLQQTDLTLDLGRRTEAAQESGESPTKSFVISLFGARDDIKAHYTAERARVCGATWKAFLEHAGATADDVWGGVEEADRKLWSARLFPVLTAGKDQDPTTGSAATDMVMWMQDVQEHSAAAAAASSSSSTPSASGEQDGGGASASAAAAARWRAAERLSFKEILAKADPRAEFQWRRQLEEGMAAMRSPAEGVGGRRYRAWDAVVAVASTLDHLPEARRLINSCSPVFRTLDRWVTAPLARPVVATGHASTAAFCVPPPRPSPASKLASSPNQGAEWDGPLVLNALLVVAERYSALKRARFGSETSAEAIHGMCILICLAGDRDGKAEGTIAQGIPGLAASEFSGKVEGGVWVSERDGRMFVLHEKSIAPLLELCQIDPQYHALTYLGADNGIPAPPTPPGASSTGPANASDFLASAAAAACTSPPEVVPSTSVEEPQRTVIPREADVDAGAPAQAAVTALTNGGGSPIVAASVAGLKELDARASDEVCTPAGAAQALARVACRLFELADALGGGGHRSGPGEHAQWQVAMRGLDTLRSLPDGRGWGPPAALPGSVAALQHLRDLWIGVEVEPHLVVRCARHYERAAAVVVSAAVRTASEFMEPPPTEWGLERMTKKEGLEGNDAGVDPRSGGASGGTNTDVEGGNSRSGCVVGSAPAEKKQEEDQEHNQEGMHQRNQHQDRISRMKPRDQAMALHSQVLANHRRIVAENGKRTQERILKERRRFEQQQGQHQQNPPQEHKGALPVGACVISRAAARIDLAGGWTDTPPISYEAGGAVLNAAVTVSGERPIEARCERIEQRSVELVCVGRDGTVTSRTVCSLLEDFTDFCIPQAPAALLKAALICAGIVSLAPATGQSASPETPSGPTSGDFAPTESPQKVSISDSQDPLSPAGATAAGDTEKSVTPSLEEQLCKVFGSGGIRITSRSGLPQGSGMGTSSILAGVVLSAACVAAGRAMSSSSLVHAVLRVEQLMTAGGGHQDQVGGLLGGVKICRTTASLPLQVLTEMIPLDPAFEDALNDRLVLIFTGKQRLARDLLQGVVRGWHDRLPDTVNTVKGLVANAENAADACRGAGDLATLGQCLSTYWEQKKRMAPGAEPPAVKALLDKLRPLCHGSSVCGAGGGGFVACITKTPGDQGLHEVTDALAQSPTDSSEVRFGVDLRSVFDVFPNAILRLKVSPREESTISVHRGQLDPVGMDVSVLLPKP